MAKRSTQKRGKSASSLLISRALMKKEIQDRARRSREAVHQNAHMAHLLGSLNNLVPDKIPTAVIRQFRAAAKRASKRVSLKPIRVTS